MRKIFSGASLLFGVGMWGREGEERKEKRREEKK
jgi:hypothetical protein